MRFTDSLKLQNLNVRLLKHCNSSLRVNINIKSHNFKQRVVLVFFCFIVCPNSLYQRGVCTILICVREILVSEAQRGEKKHKEKKREKNRRVVVLATAAASLLAGEMDRRLKRKSVPAHDSQQQQQQRSQDQSPEPPPEKHMALGPTPAADKGSRLCKYQPNFLKYGLFLHNRPAAVTRALL